MPSTVDKSRLGPMTELGRGGFGIVYRLTRFPLPGSGTLAYKEFKTRPGPEEAANLARLVDFRDRLEPRRRASLDECTTWPLVLVVDHGQVVGYVMDLLPAEFFFDQRLPSGKVEAGDRQAQWLMTDLVRAAEATITVPAGDDALTNRMVLCAKLAHTLGVLHRDGLVYGDLSTTNVLFADRPWRIMLVDCDGATDSGIQQANSPDWVPPEIQSGQQRRQDVETDRYKLALFVLRCLTPGDRASLSVDPTRLAGVLDSEGVRLARAGTGADRAARPTAKQWYRYLLDRLDAMTSPPRIVSVEAEDQLVRQGDAVGVRWEVRGADEAWLITPDGAEVAVRAADGHATVVLLRDGALQMRVRNRHGSSTAATGPVFVYAPARITHVQVPGPTLPGLDPEPRLAGVLAGLVAGTGAGPVVMLPELQPALSFLDLPDLAASSPAGLPGTDSLAGLLASLDRDAQTVRTAVARSSRAAARHT